MDPAQAPGLERKLEAILVQTAREIAHTECLDPEQRAEVYTIVESLQHDTATHHAMAEKVVRHLAGAGKAPDA
jgi:hypothetical protein